MILVDIEVPSVNTIYDFQLSETVPVGIVIDEIAEMVGQKEQCTIVGEIEGLELADIKKSRFLNKELSLNDNGIHTGDRLLLV